MSTTPVTTQPPGVRVTKNCAAWQLAWVKRGGTNAASTRGPTRPGYTGAAATSSGVTSASSSARHNRSRAQ
jgi:hypothetical protein